MSRNEGKKFAWFKPWQRILLILVLAGVCFPSGGNAETVAHYALEGNVTDSSGKGHNGTSQGTVTYQQAQVCDGVQFDGTGYLLVPDNDDFDLTDAFTVMAWIHPDTLSVSGHDNLYSFISKDANYEFHVQGNGALNWWWSGGNLITGAGVVPVGAWTHVAFVYSLSAGTLQILVNGIQVANQSYSAAMPTNTDPFYIGTDKTTGGGELPLRRFYGSIDEVRIYNGALSGGEIASLMNESDPCSLPTPLAEWRFDECGYQGAVPFVEDAQGNHHMTAQGEVESEPAGVVGRAAMADRSTDSFLTATDVPMTGDWTVSTWFRMPFSHTEGSRYHVLGAMAGGGNDLLWLDRNDNYRWGGWANSVAQSGTFRFSTLGDGWHQLVAVGQSGRTDLYIDGVLRDSISLQPSGNLHYVGTSYDQVGGEEGFRADLDEFLVFSDALNAAQIDSLYQLQSNGRNLDGTEREEILCGPSIDHYEIIHDGSALTCAPEPVTVRACADADCSTLYTDDVVINLSPSGWVGGGTQTLSGGSGVFHLRHTTPGTVTLSVSSQDPAADSGPQCVDVTGGTSCNLIFSDSGFLFDVPDLTSCVQQENIRITAVRAGAGGCVGDNSLANKTRNVNFWYSYQEPATGTWPVYVNGGAVAGASPGTDVRLSFDSEAQSLLSVRYADAGRVALTAQFGGRRGTDSFVAAPDHLRVRAAKPDGTVLDNAASTGLPHWPAGEGFTVEVAGVCADGSVTPNFAATTALSATAAVPAAGSFSGGPLAAGDYSEGVVDGPASYSEVGTVTLRAAANNYLGSGTDVEGSTGIGRFTPHHFDVSLNSPAFATACDTGGFTYVGQPFNYAAAPVIMVTAKNLQGGTTANYTGAWWKISNATLSGRTYAAALGTTLDLSALPASAVDPAVSDLGGGMGMLTFGAGGGLRFMRNVAPVASFDAEISLSINVQDGDGIAPTINPVTFGAATAGNGIPFANGKIMRWGRLALQNAYGSERVVLPMPFRAEYFNGSAFVTNTQDSCTGLASTILQLTDKNGNDYPVETPIPVGTGTDTSTATSNAAFVSGEAGLEFSAPGSEGFIDVRADLSSLPWLLFDWKGVGPEGPTARATFGIYKSRPGIIYRRETYR
jgi:MSHA biogenesis protein MshQ